MKNKGGRTRIKGTKFELETKHDLLEKCYSYLNNNFSKFSESNKIKVALALTTKDLTQKIEHSGEIQLTKEVRIEKSNRLRAYYAQN